MNKSNKKLLEDLGFQQIESNCWVMYKNGKIIWKATSLITGKIWILKTNDYKSDLFDKNEYLVFKNENFEIGIKSIIREYSLNVIFDESI